VDAVLGGEEQRPPHGGKSPRIARGHGRGRALHRRSTGAFCCFSDRSSPDAGGRESCARAKVTAAAVAAVAARAAPAARTRRRSTFAQATRARTALFFAHCWRRLTALARTRSRTTRQLPVMPRMANQGTFLRSKNARNDVDMSLAQLGQIGASNGVASHRGGA